MARFIIALAIMMMILPGQTSSINYEDNQYNKYCNYKCRTDTRSMVCKICDVWKATGELINSMSSKVDGGLSKWEAVGFCSVTCGKGTRIYKRMCNNPTPRNGGKDCTGPLEETRECLMKPCPVDGGLSKWEADGFCSVTCGKGTRIFKRMCNNPTPENGGKYCTGPLEETRECLMKPCPVPCQKMVGEYRTANNVPVFITAFTMDGIIRGKNLGGDFTGTINQHCVGKIPGKSKEYKFEWKCQNGNCEIEWSAEYWANWYWTQIKNEE